MVKKFVISSTLLLLSLCSFSQWPAVSISTDLGIQRNFKKDQRFWVIGQTITAHLHVSEKGGLYAWFAYYTNGHFKNDLVATAKSPTSFPQQINYVNKALMRLKHVSIGWKRYLKANPFVEKEWSIYAYGGLGILLGKVENSHSVSLDTAFYNVPVREGKANFKRLTLDLGLGYEQPIGGELFLYVEGRVWIPTTNYPSKYLFVNSSAPFVGMLNGGIRILF